MKFMSSALLPVFIALFSVQAWATQPKPSIDTLLCSVDNAGQDRVAVPVATTLGSLPDSTQNFQGTEVSVGFAPGSEQEPQQVLALGTDGFMSQIFDPNVGVLYKLTSPRSIQLQCMAINSLEFLVGEHNITLGFGARDSLIVTNDEGTLRGTYVGRAPGTNTESWRVEVEDLAIDGKSFSFNFHAEGLDLRAEGEFIGIDGRSEGQLLRAGSTFTTFTGEKVSN